MNISRSISLLIFLGAALTQIGCEVFYGPVITNRSPQPLTVVATFSGRIVQYELQPGGSYRQRERSLSLDALRVSDGVRTKDFTTAEIRGAVSDADRPEHVAVELLSWQQIRGASMKAKK